MDSVDYAVYTAILRSYLAEEDSTFVLMDSTLALSMDIIAEAYLVDAFRKSAPYAAHLFGPLFFYGEKRYPLQPAFSLDGKVRLMPDAEFRGLFGVGPGGAWEDHEIDGWAALRGRYPGASGRYELSRAAFDLDRSIALVFFRLRCGNVCERASYVVLRRSGDTWKVEAADVAFMQGDDHTYDAHAGPDTVYADVLQGPPPPTPRP